MLGGQRDDACGSAARSSSTPRSPSGFRYAMSDQTELLTESVLPSVGWCQARARPTPQGGLLISLRQVHAHTIETGQAGRRCCSARSATRSPARTRCGPRSRGAPSAMVRHLDAALARIWTVDASARSLQLCASAGIETALDGAGATIGFDEHKLGADRRRGRAVPDQRRDDRSARRRQRTGSSATSSSRSPGYPLRIEDRIVGVMAMYSQRKIDHDTLNALSAIADTLALGIERKSADAARRRAEERCASRPATSRCCTARRSSCGRARPRGARAEGGRCGARGSPARRSACSSTLAPSAESARRARVARTRRAGARARRPARRRSSPDAVRPATSDASPALHLAAGSRCQLPRVPVTGRGAARSAR